MYDFKPVLAALSRVLLVFSVTFWVPWAWSWWADEHRLQEIWLIGFAATFVTGVLLMWWTQKHRRELMPKDGFMLVNLVWVVLPIFAALPLWLGVGRMDWTDAYFEAVSGLTATGATVLTGLEGLPLSVNVWRCFLQLFGGLGIMLLVVAVLPLLGLGGVQLYKAETPGPMKDAKLTPRIAETARGLWGVYFVLSLGCFLAYRWAGMSWSDAFMHMSTTVSLGGMSSHDASLGYFESMRVEGVAMVFMLLAGISFARYFIVWRMGSVMSLVRDVEVRSYLVVLLVSIGLVSVLLAVENTVDSFPEALRVSAFQVISVATTTGYSSANYALWPAFAPVLLVFLGCFVSCAGSTGGGIKMVRMILLVKQARRELVRAIHPRVVNPVHLGGTAISNAVLMSVMAFMLIYGATIITLTMVLLYTGMDMVSAFTAVVATVNNIGPGLGDVGPAANYGSLTDFQTWVCTLGMMLGRLELLSVLVLFTAQFWRK